MKFENSYLLLLLFPLALFFFFYVRNRWNAPGFSIVLTGQQGTNQLLVDEIFPALKYAGLFCLVIAAAAPYEEFRLLTEENKGIAIMMALDVSESMSASRDFLPETRLDVAKKLLESFVAGRIQDRLGLVIFSGSAYLQSPLTSDIYSLQEIIKESDPSLITIGGTAIGDALVLSVYRLRESKAKSKVIVLLTDGVTNAGKFDIETAAGITNEAGIKVYAIGVGVDAEQTNFGLLETLAGSSGGKFYRARTPEELAGVLHEIDSLEKDLLPSKPQVIREKKFGGWFLAGLIFIALEISWKTFIRRSHV